MKSSILLFIAITCGLASFAQTPNTKTNTAKPVTPVLKNGLDSFSYAMGLSLGNFCNKQQIGELNTTMILKGVSDGRANSKPLMNEQEMTTVINNYLGQQSAKKAVVNKEAGEKFLSANSKNPA